MRGEPLSERAKFAVNVGCPIRRRMWLDELLEIPEGPVRTLEVWAMVVALSEAMPGDKQIEAALALYAEAGKGKP